MEKMNKAYVGTVEKWSTAHLTNSPGEITSMTFKDGTLRDNPWPFEPHEECYLVKKKDLDAYEARIEQLKRTPVWDENQLLKAKVKALEAENEALVERNTKLKCMVNKFYGMTSVGEELRAANEKLAAELRDSADKKGGKSWAQTFDPNDPEITTKVTAYILQFMDTSIH